MNVISMNDRDAVAPVASPRRAQLLGSARECAARLLGEAFRQMLERADDVLFEFAEKAETNAQQTLYFDAMRELRLKHNQMFAVFVDSFGNGFDARRRRGCGSRAAVAAMPTKLSLLDDATMEQDITTAGLAERIASACREELFALNKRLAVLLETSDLSSEDNPLGPTCIAEAARDSANGLDVDIKARLIVLKLFDRYVVSGIPGIYTAVNQHLIQQGVLPTIQTEVRRQPLAGGRGGTGAARSAGTQASQTEIMGMLEKLLRGAGEPDSVRGTVPLIPLDTAVMGTLTHLQRHAEGSGGESSGVAAHLLVDLQRSGSLPAMGPAGDMTIDIVAMLFDYILEDKNVSEGIRAKLARLQIPILKVALIDREFFSRKAHPARRLLNLIAETAVETAGDATMEAKVADLVENVVQRIVSDFDQDVGIFTRSVEALTKAFDELKREATVRASRTAKLLDGRARLEQAKEQVRSLLDTRLRPDGIPEVVRNFLLTHWRRLLITQFTTEGVDSDAWRTAIRTMDELVWSTLPKRRSEEREKLGRLLPTLLANLKQGMEQISMPAVARSGFLSKLEKAHAEAMRGEPAGTAKAGVPVLTEFLAKPVQDPLPLMNEEPNILDITTGEMSGDVEEMIAAESPPEPPAPREITEPLAGALASGAGDTGTTAESQTAAPVQPAPERIVRTPEGVESDQPAPESALPLLEIAQNAGEKLRERLAMSDEVKLSEVMPPASDLPPPSGQAARKERSVLEMTANTFYRLFAQDASREEKAAATQDLEFEELTLGDTRNPVVAQQQDEFLLQVLSLEPGTWLEFRQPDGTTVAGRYTYYTPETETYVFSDRSGRRLADRTRNGLVTDFRRGTACVTQQPAAMLDRAFTRLLDPSTWVARRR